MSMHGPNLTICMIVFVVLLIALPFVYFKERKAKKEKEAKGEVVNETVDAEIFLKGTTSIETEDDSYLADAPQNKFYRNMANVERERMLKAAKECKKQEKENEK